MNGDFIKTARNSQLADFIIRKRPTAFVLLYLIAKRAKRTNDHPDKSLEIGEAEIGDYESYGVTRQVYRTDLEWLVTNQLVTTKSTNKGTIVKLVNYEVFDINAEQPTTKLTRNQPTTNQQLTTNKNDKNEKKLRTISPYPLLSSIGDAEIQRIADLYQVPPAFVRSRVDDMENWMEATGKRPDYYKNYYRALCDWVKKDALKVKQQGGTNAKPNIIYAGDTA
jgi:hypothetical protein